MRCKSCENFLKSEFLKKTDENRRPQSNDTRRGLKMSIALNVTQTSLNLILANCRLLQSPHQERESRLLQVNLPDIRRGSCF